jgi:hypothetical protein
MAGLPEISSMRDSVTRVTTRPWVCGLIGDSCSTIQVMLLAAHQGISSMVDGGGNICICLTNIISLLVDIGDILPPPILVAVAGSDVTMDECCTKLGLLLLTLADGSVYYRTCYYCKNEQVETIISPQAILDGSGILLSGHRLDTRTTVLAFYGSLVPVVLQICLLYLRSMMVCITLTRMYTRWTKTQFVLCTPQFNALSTPNHQALVDPFRNMCRCDLDALGRYNWTCSLEMSLVTLPTLNIILFVLQILRSKQVLGNRQHRGWQNA